MYLQNFFAISHRHNTINPKSKLLKQQHNNQLQLPSMFSIYIHKSTLCLVKAINACKAAFDVVKSYLKE